MEFGSSTKEGDFRRGKGSEAASGRPTPAYRSGELEMHASAWLLGDGGKNELKARGGMVRGFVADVGRAKRGNDRLSEEASIAQSN